MTDGEAAELARVRTIDHIFDELVATRLQLDEAVVFLQRAAELLADARDETPLLHEIGAFLAQLGVDRVPYEPRTS
jgi:hypothetical protein